MRRWSRGVTGGVMVAVLSLAGACGEADDPGAGALRDALAQGPVASDSGLPDGLAAPSCELFEHVADFTPALRETSGLARSSRAAGVLWTHNDSGGEPSLTALDRNGTVLGSVRVADARNIDWEALSAGPCPEDDCLFVGDIGDNANEREPVRVYRIPEPAPDAGTSAPARAWSVRYPGGPRDAEALAVHPSTGEAWIVAKGRAHPVQVFRVPLSDEVDEALAEPVLDLTDRPVPPPRMITGASFTPDGRWLLVRSYTELFFLPVVDGVPQAPLRPAVDLTPLEERQGEAVETFPEGWVYFTSEAVVAGGRPELTRARCAYPETGTEGAP
ncbi:MAG TPA: hypothetical protein VK837_03250 [Longimicrobiales bacterium]|nr:hypothetical protein [Longimicrobiales bacterium]